MVESDADLATMFADFGVAAVYRPLGGSASDDMPCVVLRDRQDREVGSELGRPIAQGDAITVSAAEIAEPEKGGTFTIAGDVLKIESDPTSADPDRRVWVCVVQMTDPLVSIAWQGDLKTFSQDLHLRFARGARIAAERQSAQSKLAFRGPIRAALGDRVANALRVDIYPQSASVRTHAPTVYVWTKAPKIIAVFSKGATIKSREGHLWLAIPTDATPRVGRKFATPVEVEARFDQDLIFIKGRGGQILAFIDKTLRGKFKRARKKGKSIAGISARYDKLVLMFVLVRQVTLKKRFDWDGISKTLGQSWLDIFGSEVAAALNR